MHNLIQSNWIRDKGYGMGARIPRLVSPVTGEEEAGPLPDTSSPRPRRTSPAGAGWWRVANIEQFVTFFALGTISIVLMSMIAYSTVYGQEFGENLDFFRNEVRPWARPSARGSRSSSTSVARISLLAGAMGILDYVGRCVADVLKSSYLGESRSSRRAGSTR